jgi:pyruvate kinase
MKRCLCGELNCEFLKRDEEMQEVPSTQKFIYKPRNIKLSSKDFIHMLINGTRVFNFDLTFNSRSNHLAMLSNFNKAIEVFGEKFEFNVPITKICTIRSRTPRIGRMRNDCSWRIKGGDLIVLTSYEIYKNCSTNEICYVTNLSRFIPMLQICDVIYVEVKSEESIELQIVKIVGEYVTCCVQSSGRIESYLKLVFTQFNEQYHDLLEQEKEDCNFAIENNFDFIIVPNVRHAKYYHQLRKITRGSKVKLIAKIEEKLEEEVIEKIIEHFHAVELTIKSYFEIVLAKSKELQKTIIANFQHEKCLNKCLTKIFNNVDSIMLKGEPLEVVEQIKNFSALLLQNESNKPEGDKINYTHTQQEKESQIKAVVCLTNSGKAVRDIASYDKYRYIIALTKDKTLAKRMNLMKRVLPMIYVNCSEDKSVEDQKDEMMRIALKFGKAMGIIVSEEPVVEELKV